MAYSHLLRIKQIIAIAFIIGKLISYKVWLVDRTFPVLPFLDFLNAIPSGIHSALFASSLLLLLINTIWPSKNNLLILFLIIESCSILLDETRLQAWVYEYLLLLFPFVFLHENSNEGKVFSALKWILIATYFWSGFYKWNMGFILTVWQPASGIPIHSVWLKMGYIIPVLEMLFAIGLAFQRSKKIASIGLIIMHVFILIVFGPFGMNYNISIWPWNVCMILLLAMLFLHSTAQEMHATINKKISWQFLVVVLCIMPVGNVFELWRDELSFKLYSGKTNYLYVCLTDNEWGTIPLELNHSAIKVPFCKGSMLSIKAWTMQEMNVMPCNNKHYFNKLTAVLSAQNFKGADIHFWLHESPYDSTAIHEWK